MKVKCLIVALVVSMMAAACPARADVQEMVETFNGEGEYAAVNGGFWGLDNPDWRIRGDGEFRDGGLAIVNEAITFDGVRDLLFRPVYGRGSFSTRVEIKEVNLGEVGEFSPLGSQGVIVLRHVLDLEPGQRFNALRMGVFESESAAEDEWRVSLYVAGTFDLENNFVTGIPRGDHISLGIDYDEVLSQAIFSYDHNLNDELPP